MCHCFLNEAYTYTYRVLPLQELRTFHLEKIIDELLDRKLDEKKEELYEKNSASFFS